MKEEKLGTLGFIFNELIGKGANGVVYSLDVSNPEEYNEISSKLLPGQEAVAKILLSNKEDEEIKKEL